MSGINDFVVKFATVNGSGSASANTIFAKTLFRMGIPVSPKNIFPSNIQGLPTWYEVRVSEAGYVARREGIDLMVAMNPQSYKEDLAAIVPGGWLLYDSTLPRIWPRDDITVLGIPIAEMCAAHWKDPRQRQLFKNMVYVGALMALLEIDLEVLKGAVGDQLKGKEKLIAANMEAVELGRAYAAQHFDCPLPIKVRHAERAKGKIMVTGNDAGGLGAIYAGATVCAWYPITPSTSLAEYVEKYAQAHARHQGRQADVRHRAGRGRAGGDRRGRRRRLERRALVHRDRRARHLADERVRRPCLLRRDPGRAVRRPARRTLAPACRPARSRRTSSCAYASHGDSQHVLLFPANPTECFSMGAQAFDLAERFQTPVMVMTDLDIGMNDWVTEPFAWDDAHVHDRGKVLDAETSTTSGTSRARTGAATWTSTATPFLSDDAGHASHRARISPAAPATTRSRDTARTATTGSGTSTASAQVRDGGDPGADARSRRRQERHVGLIAFGGTTPAVLEARDHLREGVTVNALRIGLPVRNEVDAFVARHDRVYVVEQNRDGQVAALLRSTLDGTLVDRLVSIPHYNGTPIAAENIVRPIIDREKNHAGLGACVAPDEADPSDVPRDPKSRPNERTSQRPVRPHPPGPRGD